MDATVWAGTGKKQLGIRVGAMNRARYFSTSWQQVVVEMDGQLRHFNLSPGFWKEGPEFRDGPDGPIKAWLGMVFWIGPKHALQASFSNPWAAAFFDYSSAKKHGSGRSRTCHRRRHRWRNLVADFINAQ
jgi:hypothetical protein